MALAAPERGLRGGSPMTPASRSLSSSRVDGSSLPLLYGTAWKKERTTELVVAAVRAGFRGIDTACQPKHYSEELVGVAVAALEAEGVVSRKDLWLQTKFTPLSGQDPDRIPYDAAAPLATQVSQSVERSLANLGTAWIDSLVLHSPLRSFDETLVVWRAMERAVTEGKVTQLGISNCYDVATFRRLYDEAAVKPRVLQNRFYAKTGFDVELRALCRARGVTYQTFWTLTANPDALKSTAIQQAARRLAATPQQVLFRFLVQAGHQPLTGTTSQTHMLQDLFAVQSSALTKDEMGAIGGLFH